MYTSVVTELIFNNTKVWRIIKQFALEILYLIFMRIYFTAGKDQKCFKTQILLHVKNLKETNNEN